jgi:hypothetical protein
MPVVPLLWRYRQEDRLKRIDMRLAPGKNKRPYITKAKTVRGGRGAY